MSFIREYRAYASLTEDQKRFIKEKVIEGSRTPSDWLAFLGNIAEYDRHGDFGRKILGYTGCISVAALVMSFFFMGAFKSPVPILVLLPIAIVTLTLYFIRKKSDLPNNFRQFLVPLVSILREEISASEPLYLRLDFRGRMLDDKQTGAPKLKPGQKPVQLPGARIIDEKYYADLWLSARARLADATRLELQITDYTRKRVVARRKVKTKYKIKTLIEARVGLAQEDYALVGQAAGGGDKVNVKTGEKRNAIRVRRVVVAASEDSVLILKDALDVIARAYKQVAPNQAGGK
jgi:hypothetical protein